MNRPHPRVSLVCADALHALLGEDDDSFAGAFFDPPYGLGEEPAPEEIRAYLDGSDLRTGDFLGHAWDVPPIRVWREVFRVLAPGAHLVVFGGTRTFDLISLGIRMAGFELRDTISGEGVARWYRGVGFPQGADVGKMIDKARPHRRADVLRVTAWIRAQRDARGLTNAQIDAACGTNGMAGHWTSASRRAAIPSLEKWEILRTMLGDAPEWMVPLLHSARQPGEAWFRRPVVGKHDNPAGNGGRLLGVQTGHGARGRDVDLTAAAGDLSAAFEGYKTQLKGLWEPILVFRKPLGALSIAACAVEHATGAFNVDECRLSTSERMNCAPASSTGKATYGEMRGYERGTGRQSVDRGGRFPPNVVVCHTPACVLDGPPHRWECSPECPVAEIDAQSGELAPRRNVSPSTATGDPSPVRYGPAARASGAEYNHDADGLGGGASRFFYRGRATKGERSDGCADLLWVRDESRASGWRPVDQATFDAAPAALRARGNVGPCVKPLDLDEWIGRLIRPPRGLTLPDGRPRALRALNLYAGTGSEAIGLVRAGWDEVVSVERDPDFALIASTRFRAERSREDDADLERLDEALPRQRVATPVQPFSIATPVPVPRPAPQSPAPPPPSITAPSGPRSGRFRGLPYLADTED